MLVVGLRKGEEIRVGDAVVKVLGYRNGQMRLGIEAPEGVGVERPSGIGSKDETVRMDQDDAERAL